MYQKLRRLRRTNALRSTFRETRWSIDQLVFPLFVQENITEPVPILSMPGQERLPVIEVADTIDRLVDLGLRNFLLFGVPARKDGAASAASDPDGPVPSALRRIRAQDRDVTLWTDVCICSYTDHGHCGMISESELEHELSVRLLGKMAVCHAQAGADLVAPSASLDGQTAVIRRALDEESFTETAIVGYGTKFASAYYGPFREAADSAPTFGDRRAYQLDAANPRHARRELLAEVEEGADAVMVKPGLAYLDMVRQAREASDVPIVVYNVSGEYAMVKAAAAQGWVDERAIVLETMGSFFRAGADLVVTYHAPDIARWLSESR